MSRIEPFKAVFYTAAQGEPHLHAAPPYDIISAKEHAALLAGSPYNIVRVTLGERPDAAPDFSGAAERLAAWVKDGILAVDAAPRYYLYAADFVHEGNAYSFIGLAGKVDLAAARVRDHEKTIARVKQGRLAQLAGVRGNVELVFLVCEDDGAFLKLMQEGKGACRLTVPVKEGETHAVFDLEDAAAARAAALLDGKEFVIADGHHRFQTAARYWKENPGVEGARYCLAVAGSLAPSSGLRIAPYHRALTFPSRERARAWASEVAGALPAASGAADVTLHSPGAEEGVARAFRGRGESLVGHLHKNFIDTLPSDAAIEYTRDLTGAVGKLRQGAPIVAVRVRAVTTDELFATVKAGKVFPPKSTYFHPKLWSGMVMRLFEFDR
ncbi:MAG TPA: hypothetical protein DCM87_04400 [Planctomycetes bacterium]|nr:hypothetical protein [Planctomycetota bacterium]